MGPGTTRPRSLLLLAPSLVLALLGWAASPALAQAVGCGAVLTQDTTLTADLVDCPGDGLVIGADGITVDLGGHLVDGVVYATSPPVEQVAIDNRAGHDDVTVRNGTVQEFTGGVQLVRVDRNRVLDLRLSRLEAYGVRLEGGSANRFAGNTLERPGDLGVAVSGPARDNRIVGNLIDSAYVAGVALRTGSISGTVIDGNEIRNTVAAGDTAGIKVATGPGDVRGTLIRRNDLRFNTGGVEIGAAATDTAVEVNTLVDNAGTAVRTAGDRTVISANTIDSNWAGAFTDWGVLVDQPARATRVEANAIYRFAFAGIDDSGRGTVIARNLLDGQLDPETWVGILGGIIIRPEARRARVHANLVRRVAGAGFEGGGIVSIRGDDVAVTANAVTDSRSPDTDGIRVEPTADRVLLKGNRASRHGDDGIDVDSPATTVTGNVANDNADLGIEAVAGVTDGGGNRASGNGNPAQCVGVVCA
jgi:hypothetical protein